MVEAIFKDLTFDNIECVFCEGSFFEVRTKAFQLGKITISDIYGLSNTTEIAYVKN